MTYVDSADLASSAPGKGAEMVGFDNDTAASRLNILSATMRPAMRGIFSGSGDQRAALLAFINEAAAGGKTIEWGPVDVSLDVVTQVNNLRGLAVPSGSRWVMHPDTRFRALPNSADHYEIINLYNASDVLIEGCGARVIGERSQHTGSTGEWGHGVNIIGSTGIRIRDLHVQDCWGDGFYVGSTAAQGYVQDVLLDTISADNCRRNGLSLISARGLRCIDSRFVNTSGTNPQCGIDIEPNALTEYLEEIEFIRPFTSGNTNYGISVYLNAMEGSTNPVGVRIVGHVDDGSITAFSAGRAVNIPGLVEYINGKSMNAHSMGIVSRAKAASGPRYKIINPVIVDWNRSGSSSTTFASAVLLYADANDSGTFAVGGIDIVGPDLKLNSGSGTNAIACIDQRTTTPDPMQDIRIVEPLDLAGLLCFINGVERFHDPLRKSVRTLSDSSATIPNDHFARHVDIPALTATHNFDINNKQAIGIEITFSLVDAGPGMARIRFPSGVSLSPDTLGAGLIIQSNTKGSRLTIRKTAASEWMVIEKVGTWVTA